MPDFGDYDIFLHKNLPSFHEREKEKRARANMARWQRWTSFAFQLSALLTVVLALFLLMDASIMSLLRLAGALVLTATLALVKMEILASDISLKLEEVAVSIERSNLSILETERFKCHLTGEGRLSEQTSARIDSFFDGLSRANDRFKYWWVEWKQAEDDQGNEPIL